jgi:hypothetical protein
MKPKRIASSGLHIESCIYILRGEKVMLSNQLAELYAVETKVLMQAVKRNRTRFPEDFMFQLTREEVNQLRTQPALRSQFVTLKRGKHLKYLPYAFTEQGVAMLSSVLRSERAVCVNIEIMRAFVQLRRIVSTNADLVRKLASLEKKYDAQFKVVFAAIRELMKPPDNKRKRQIGFASGSDTKALPGAPHRNLLL